MLESEPDLKLMSKIMMNDPLKLKPIKLPIFDVFRHKLTCIQQRIQFFGVNTPTSETSQWTKIKLRTELGD